MTARDVIRNLERALAAEKERADRAEQKHKLACESRARAVESLLKAEAERDRAYADRNAACAALEASRRSILPALAQMVVSDIPALLKLLEKAADD